MMKSRLLKLTIIGLVSLLLVQANVFLVHSATGYIRINSRSASFPGQAVQAGTNVNLYFGEVSWSGNQFYLLMSLDNYEQVSVPDVVFTPRFALSDLTNPTTRKTYTNSSGTWVLGSNWVNGTIAQNIPVGNYTIKAFDEVSGTVAVTDTFIVVYSVTYSSTLQVSPASGPGGISATFAGSGFPPSSTVTISYLDTAFGSWNAMATTVADASGSITLTANIPDMKKTLGAGDYPEAYTRISYRAEINGVVYCYTDYNQNSRGLKRVGAQTAAGLYGDGTNFVKTINVAPEDTLTISGKWFHPGDAIYVRWDSLNVVGTVTANEWRNAQIIGTAIANSAGSFDVTATVPKGANTGEHYIATEDSQTKVRIKVYVSMATLSLSPASGPGGVTVEFTGSRYPPSTPVTISYKDPTFGFWNTFGTTTSDASGKIQFSGTIPDLRRSLTGYDAFESPNPVSFRSEQGSTVYCYADYNQYPRGLKTVGSKTATGLFGNGTNLSYDLKVLPGDAITVSGKWFHVGDVIYIRWDGQAVVGTVTGNEWRNTAIIGTAIADSTGSFHATATIPTAFTGEHYVSIEDSQAKVIIKVAIAGENYQNNTRRVPSTIGLSCKSTTSYIGYKVEITGTLSSNAVGIANQPILLSQSANAGRSWQDLTQVYTAEDGTFLAVWMPSVSGNYLIKATYNGNSVYNTTSKIVTLASAPFSDRNVFSVTSNSTVSQLSFNSTKNELAFVVSGESGTQGFVNVGIAKSLIADVSNLNVYLDGASIEYTSSSTTDSWIIHFSYSHSTHKVAIDIGQVAAPTSGSQTNTPSPTSTGASPTGSSSPIAEPTTSQQIPEFQAIAVLVVMLASVSLVLLVVRKRRMYQAT